MINLSVGFSELCRVLRYLGSLSGKLEETVKANKLLRLFVATIKVKFVTPIWNPQSVGEIVTQASVFFRRTTGGR